MADTKYDGPKEDFGPNNAFKPLILEQRRQTAIQYGVESILMGIGEDAMREGLVDTPKRVAKAYDELCAGYTKNPQDVLRTFEEAKHDQMVLVKDIPFFSLCEHHMLPFRGVAHIGYVPAGRILGLSKFARIVDIFARRLQVQERMTDQVADALMGEPLSPRGVMVVVEAEHFCMAMRGVEKQGSRTMTSSIRGVFNNPEKRAREEFLSLLRCS